MQKKQIKAGEVYGYVTATTEYRTARPVIVLDAKNLWTWRRNHGSAPKVYRVSNNSRYTAAYYTYLSYTGPHGYLALLGRNLAEGPEREEHLAKLKELYDFFAKSAGNPDAVAELSAMVSSIDDVSLDIINNRWLEGDYAAVKAAEEQRQQSREAIYRAERDRAAVRADFIARAGEVISQRIDCPSFRLNDYFADKNSTVTISIEALALLLGIEPPAKQE